MILKFCAWPSVIKEENSGGGINVEGMQEENRTERKIVDAVFRCCPCVFRSRKSIGVAANDNDDDNGSVSTIITATISTPVIALKLNHSRDTVYVLTFIQ